MTVMVCFWNILHFKYRHRITDPCTHPREFSQSRVHLLVAGRDGLPDVSIVSAITLRRLTAVQSCFMCARTKKDIFQSSRKCDPTFLPSVCNGGYLSHTATCWWENPVEKKRQRHEHWFHVGPPTRIDRNRLSDEKPHHLLLLLFCLGIFLPLPVPVCAQQWCRSPWRSERWPTAPRPRGPRLARQIWTGDFSQCWSRNAVGD